MEYNDELWGRHRRAVHAICESMRQATRDQPLFSAHYDTVNAGPKTHAASYTKICAELGHSVQKVTFLTDNVKEAEAAMQAGVYTVVVDRPGNAPLDDEARGKYPVIEKLTDLP
ncbi:hypothetical protein PTRG_03759 [Pyrenophora tritici-repentis Pt-1C-BFP]|uniref:Uncharacterized protein n=1 Tax=Pyrenophora tritici-repentis (strain Pt-1C-BFP) TaxID=426418 RepID=B2W2W1_PYRTR|nr:uncharacterized protein PTRG_03759 [Pyrenophora tritici-repentis Pt-1C-BFP]EDU46597.1 hypothetical protein PTRG_03759 [Pyrenophora tritici-repentis Pt-1C-BFP]